MPLVAFLAGLLVAVLTSAAAAAPDDLACVQRELVARGYLAAAARDGRLDPATRAAADAFTAATSFPMPVLGPLTGGEWCNVLSGFDRRDASPFGAGAIESPLFAPYHNPDPAALPLGIYFQGDVPTYMRAAIVTDLRWLIDRGPLRDAGELAAFLGLPPNPTGADLAAWLLRSIRSVKTAAACPRRIYTIPRPVSGLAPAVAHDLDCSPKPANYAAFVSGGSIRIEDTAAEIADLGDRVILYPGVMRAAEVTINATVNRSQGFNATTRLKDAAGSIARLAILAHEAMHFIDGTAHVECDRVDFLFDPKNRIAALTGIDSLGLGRGQCDDGYGAYAVGGMVGVVLAKNCDCRDIGLVDALRIAADDLARASIPLAAPWPFPGTTLFDDTGLRGRTFTALPARPFFEASALMTATAAGLWSSGGATGALLNARRDTVRALADFVEKRFDADPAAFAGGWAPPRRPAVDLDVAWAAVWVERALRAADAGYNVPLTWVTPCSTSPVGCASDWRRDMPAVAVGTWSDTYVLNAAGETKVFRVVLPPGAEKERSVRLTLSVLEEAGSPFDFHLQCRNVGGFWKSPGGSGVTRPAAYPAGDCYVTVREVARTPALNFRFIVDIAAPERPQDAAPGAAP